MLKVMLRRELITPLHRKRMIVFQIGLAMVFGLLVAIRWPTDGHVALTGAVLNKSFVCSATDFLPLFYFCCLYFRRQVSSVKKSEEHWHCY